MKNVKAGVLASAVIATGLVLGVSRAGASVFETFNVNPTEISQAGSATLDLGISVFPDGADFNAYFTGGTVTLLDGLGDSQSFSITYGLASESFSATFTYPNPGNFSPSFSVIADYSEEYYYQQYVQTGGYYYSCGFWGFDTCFQPYYSWETFVGTNDPSQDLSGGGSLNVDPAPLPAALPLFASGIGGLGLLGWRRKRKAQAVA